MNFSGGLACMIVALSCAQYAVGAEHQSLFMPNMLWVWWIPAVCWLLSGLGLFIRMFAEA